MLQFCICRALCVNHHALGWGITADLSSNPWFGIRWIGSRNLAFGTPYPLGATTKHGLPKHIPCTFGCAPGVVVSQPCWLVRIELHANWSCLKIMWTPMGQEMSSVPDIWILSNFPAYHIGDVSICPAVSYDDQPLNEALPLETGAVCRVDVEVTFAHCTRFRMICGWISCGYLVVSWDMVRWGWTFGGFVGLIVFYQLLCNSCNIHNCLLLGVIESIGLQKHIYLHWHSLHKIGMGQYQPIQGLGEHPNSRTIHIHVRGYL